MKNRIWVNIHSCVSGFFLPIAVIYAVTGAIAIFDSHGQHDRARHQQAVYGDESPRAAETGSHEDSGLYDRLLSLHKGQGGTAVRTLGVAFAAAVIVIYFSGIFVCWKDPRLRRQLLFSAAVGLVVTAIVIATGSRQD